MEHILNQIIIVNNFVTENYLYSIILYSTFLILYASFSLPGLIIFISLSGYIFGLNLGYLISIFSFVIGSSIFFLISKLLFKNFFSRYYSKYSQHIDKYIQNSSYEYLIIFRLLPGFPLFIQNLILSMLNISLFKYILISFIGFTPLIFLSVYVGNKINDINSFQNLTFKDILSWDFLILLLIIVIFLLIRIVIKNKKPS